MKRTLIVLFGMLIAALSTPLRAQQNSLLWKVSGNGLSSPSYLYGTIHIMCDQTALEPFVTDVIGKSGKVYLELDLDDPGLQNQIQKLSIDPSMQEFYDQLDAFDKDAINEFLREKYNADLTQLGMLKPFALMTLILVKRVPCDQFTSMEDLIMKMARSKGKRIIGLETVAFQMGVFDKIPKEDQMQWIMDILDSDYEYEFQDMLDAYKEQDLEELEYLMQESPGFENYVGLMIYDRNRDWIPKIEAAMKQGSTFVAVGAGHLSGSQGVLTLLEDKGYTVEPVK